MSKTKKETDKNTGKSDNGKPKTPAQQVRELGICLAVAIAIAFLIKYVLVEVFVIPSGSMEPTLNGRPDGGDRVLCTKVNYHWRRPRRWEIFVFKYPYKEAQIYTNGQDANFKGQNFIKRCIGLPTDRGLAIARGDIFTLNSEDVWKREVKTDRIQRSIWIPVYHEDFSDLKPDELLEFWNQSGEKRGSTLTISSTGILRIKAAGSTHLAYRPRLPTGFPKQAPITLDGIPDRYVVRQPVTFTCPYCNHSSTLPDSGPSSPAGPLKQFRKTVQDQKIAGRCPHCGRYLLENSVTFYGRRSGLPIVGQHSYAGDSAIQGEHDKKRRIDYHFVSDLRARVRIRFGSEPGLRFIIEIKDDERQLQAVVSPNSAWLELCGRPLEPPKSINLQPGKWHIIEFYQADNVLRLFIDNNLTPVLTHAFNDPKPAAFTVIRSSGVMLSLRSGSAELDWIDIGRDIYYYSGHEHTEAQAGYHDFPLLDKYGVFILDNSPNSSKRGYIAMGDNSPSSNDSRTWGPVPPGNLCGPALFVWWPLHRIHLLTIPK